VAGDRKATGVSIFSTGGNIGIALGPPLLTVLLTNYGLPGSLGMLVPGLIVAGLLTAVLPRLSAPAPTVARDRASAAGAQTMVGAMSLLILVVAIRSWTQLGFTTFMPFYWKDWWHAVGPMNSGFQSFAPSSCITVARTQLLPSRGESARPRATNGRTPW
jgi:FSR family fosmidomycin resistance protein-like MFS transporter